MESKRVGQRTVKLKNNPTIISAACVVGPKEGKGPLKDYFNLILEDDLYGEKSSVVGAICKRRSDKRFFVVRAFFVSIAHCW